MIRSQAVTNHATETGHTEFKPSPFRAGTVDCQQCPWQYPPVDDLLQLITITGGPLAGAAFETDRAAAAIRFRVVPEGGDKLVDIDLPIEATAEAGVFVVRWPENDPTTYLLAGTPIPLHIDGTEINAEARVDQPGDMPTLLPTDPPAGVRLLEDAHQHIKACDDGSRYCPARDYEANPIVEPCTAMTDGDGTEQIWCDQPAGHPQIEDDSDQASGLWDHANRAEGVMWNDETADPGPVPAEPEVPPLTLRDRIANVVDRHFADKFDNDGYNDTDQNQRDLVDAVHAEVGAGADWAPVEEAVEMTPAQALAYLLNLPEWARIERLGRLLEEARRSHVCFVMDHEGAVEMCQALLIRERRHLDALNRIGKLCTNLDGGETDLQNMIGTIAAEALVRRD